MSANKTHLQYEIEARNLANVGANQAKVIQELHALNAELLEALEAALEHAYIPHGKPWLENKIRDAIAKARN